MGKTHIFGAFFLLAAVSAAAADTLPAPAHLRTEYLANPLGIDTPRPRFGWWMDHPESNQRQAACQVRVAESPEALNGGAALWDTGKVGSRRTVNVAYEGPPLASCTRYYWAVRLWDKSGTASAWSEPAWFETALLEAEDFAAQWIRPPKGMGDSFGFRTEPDRRAERISVVLDLGEVYPVAAVALYPAAPPGKDDYGYGFPGGFEVELAEEAGHSGTPPVLEVTGAEPPEAGAATFTFSPTQARYVRLTTTEPAGSRFRGYFLALAELAVQDEAGRNVAVGAAVDAPASDETHPWGKQKLVDGVNESKKVRSVSPLLRKHFTVKPGLASARAYASGMGYYELYLNGARVGDHVLDPGNTVAAKRKLYSTYDVADHLREGENVAGMMLGHGWHHGQCAAWLQLRLVYDDGRVETVLTDPSWKVATGPIVDESLFNGETYDARRERIGWETSGYDDSAWHTAEAYDRPPEQMSAQAMPPIRVTQQVQPVSVTARGENTYILDFGWNLTGWLTLSMTGPRGTAITMRHAELLHEDGSLNTATLETAKQTDTYIVKGEGEETYTPRFTQHGFRYAEVTGYPGTLTADEVTAEVIHTSFDTIGTFDSGSALFNDVYTMALRSILGNSMSIPTDCPQRGERMGWLGDVHLVIEPTLHVFDACAYYENFLRSIADAQYEDGRVPDTVPYYMFGEKDGSPAWALCYPLLTWYLYRYCGDERVVHEHYDNIVRWFGTLEAKAAGHLLEKAMYGDWVGIEGTPGPIIASGVYYWSAELLREMAAFLGRDGDVARFEQRKADIAAAFNAELFDAEANHYGNGSQFSQVWPVYLGIAQGKQKEAALAQLRRSITGEHEGHLATGILGTKYLFDVLTDNGMADLAYTVALQEDYPGWGYMLDKGATTLWERWEYMTGNDMNSHNHQMYASILGWYFGSVAGLRALPEPGYRRFTIAPAITDRFDHATAATDTVAGHVACGWQRVEDGVLVVEATVPPNTQAEVILPDMGAAAQITQNGAAIDARTFTVGSGTYTWRIK
ncbi:MAG: family 78 glycoside hydrolase catalytic domain [Candidatus Hydrogenedentota bacterium]